KLGGINITNVNLYNAGTVIETGSSTRDCELIHDDLVHWAMELVGLELQPGPDRRFFVSELQFQSELRMDALSQAFTNLSSRISGAVSQYGRQQFNCEPVAIVAMPDLSNIKLGPTAFRIDRLAGVPFEDKKYYSSAPLHTEEHISLLEEFEKYLV